MSTANQHQTGKFYTAARKFQQLIGVTPAGEALPGGPYTVTQFVVGIVCAVLGFISRPLWTQGAIADVLIIVALAVGATYVTGRIPGSRRSLINLVNCVMSLLLRPTTGTYRGKKLPSSYSKVPPKRTKKDALAAQVLESEPPVNSAITHVQITSGLDRLTADLTTAH